MRQYRIWGLTAWRSEPQGEDIRPTTRGLASEGFCPAGAEILADAALEAAIPAAMAACE